jgi:hypothetical protein
MTLRPRTLALAFATLGVAGGFLYFLLDGGSAPAPADVPEAVSGPVRDAPDGAWTVRRSSGTYAGYRVDEEYLTVGVRTAVGRTIRFARFGIDPPSTVRIVTVRDHRVLEFRLVLGRSR